MTNNSPMPDALTVAFPRLLSEIPEARRAFQLITFDAIPGANEITTQFIIDGEAFVDEPITEVIEIEQDELVDEQVDFALDEPIPGDETVTQFIDVPAPLFHRGRRRAKSDFPYAMALLALAGVACLAYGVVVQTSELVLNSPLLAAVSLPALVFSGVCLTLAILQKR